MSADAPIILHGNDVFSIEVRGFDHIPEPERNMSLRQVDYLWVGTSLNLLGFALGAMAITLGLNLWLAFVACILGNLTYVYLAFGSIITTRAGLPVSTLARAAFGRRGNLPNGDQNGDARHGRTGNQHAQYSGAQLNPSIMCCHGGA